MKKLPPLKRFQTLTQDQRDQIVAWLEEGKSYRWIIKQTAKPLDQGGFGEPVPKTCLWRFNKRRLAVQSGTLKKSFGDLSQIARDINHYAATGECGAGGEGGQPGTGFHSATVHLIEKQALELALDQSDHDRLKDLFRMKLAHENSQTKKTYSTHRIELEKEKLEHRKQVAADRVALDNRKQDLREKQFEHQKSVDEKKFPAPEPPAPPLTPEQKQEKLWDIFCLSEEERARRRAKNKPATETSSCAFPLPGGEGQGEGVLTDHSVPVARAARAEGQGERVLTSLPADPCTEPQSPSKIENQKQEIKDSSVQPPCPLCLSGEPHLDPANLAKRSDAYTILRAEEYWAHRRAEDAWYEQQTKRPDLKGRPPQYRTRLLECPCGCALPCPHHKEFCDHFWKVSPHDPFYAQSLQDRNIPYREPKEFLAEKIS